LHIKEAIMGRRTIVVALLAIVALAVGVWVYTAYLAPQPEPEVVEELEESGDRVVPATGVVVPYQWATLSIKMGGLIQDVLVEEGDQVEEGQLLVMLDSSDLEDAVALAEGALITSQAALAQVQAPPRAEELAVAQASLGAAQAQLSKLTAGATNEQRTAARGALETAALALQQAQAAYDEVSWLEEINEMPQALALQQATMQYEIAKANYDAVVKGPSSEDIAVVEAEVARARASLAVLTAGARPEDVAVAQAGVAQAELALTQARSALEDAELRAPFAGSIGSLMVRAGEMVSPGAPVVFLGDVSLFKVETTDLNEIEVNLVKVGQDVVLTFDALPERSFGGKVVRIAPMANMEQGGTNFTVTVELDQQDPGLRWGMTAFVDIFVGAE
jgi:HlyD family secretion protein